MQGLRLRSRLRAGSLPPEASLPARAHDPTHCPPDPEELAALARVHLRLDRTSTLDSARLLSAEWNPHRSILALYRLRFSTGAEELVTYQAASRAELVEMERKLLELTALANASEGGSPRLHAVVPGDGFALWRFPGDPFLPALAQLELTPNEGPPWELLRYLPGRSAILRASAVPECPFGSDVVLRMLPAAAARRAATTRRLHPSPHAIPLLAERLDQGMLIEPYLETTEQTLDGSFREAAGTAIASIHQGACGGDIPSSGGSLCARALPWLLAFPGTESMVYGLVDPAPPEASTWVLGRFQPETVVFDRAGARIRLLDLDHLGCGNPNEDLGRWIAAELWGDLEADPTEIAASLLLGYVEASGRCPDQTTLMAAVASQLVRRSALALRRLEPGGLDQAVRALALARQLAPADALFI